MEQVAQVQQNTKSYLPQNIPITYLWFGKSVPEDNLISLADLDFPVVFLKNPKINRNFTRQLLDVQKSDYYRLQYLYEYGGIYSDLDNIIDYSCVMKLLQPYRTQDKLVFQSVDPHTRQKLQQITNGMIFSPHPQQKDLKKIIQDIDENKGKIWWFAGLRHLGQYKQPIELDMTSCVVHTGDWSWFKDSNEALNRKTPPHARFRKKLIKKKDLIVKQQQLSGKLQDLKSYTQKLTSGMNEMIQQNKQVIAQLKDFDGSLNILNNQDIIGQIDSDYVLSEVKTYAWNREKQTMQSYIGSLEERNSHLKQEKDIVLLSIAGLSIVLLIVLVFSYFMIKVRINKRLEDSQLTKENSCQKFNAKF